MNTQRNEPRTWTVPEPDGPRSLERIDGGFVLVNSWQVRHEPTAEHRAAIARSVTTGPNRKARRAVGSSARVRTAKTDAEFANAYATRASYRAIKRERRHEMQMSPLAYEWTAEERRAMRNVLKRQRRARR